MGSWKNGRETKINRRAACAALCVLSSACGSKLDLGGQVGTDGGANGADSGSGAGQCAFEVTIANVAFYGKGTPGTSICDGVVPPVSTIMNQLYMVAAGNGTITYGDGTSYSWSTYTNRSPGQIAPTTNLDPPTGDLTLAGQVSSPSGTPQMCPDGNPGTCVLAGLGFKSDQCVNPSAYEGVSFEMTGDLGDCHVVFEVDTSEDSSHSFGNSGQCEASICATPSHVLTNTGTFQLPFSAFGNGTPQAAVDTASVQSLQWVFTAP